LLQGSPETILSHLRRKIGVSLRRFGQAAGISENYRDVLRKDELIFSKSQRRFIDSIYLYTSSNEMVIKHGKDIAQPKIFNLNCAGIKLFFQP
jgi:hypothetical protein